MKPDKICHIDDVPEMPEVVGRYSSEIPVFAILRLPNTKKEIYAFDESMAEWEESIRCRSEIAAHQYLAHHARGWEKYVHERQAWEKSMQLASIAIERRLRQVFKPPPGMIEVMEGVRAQMLGVRKDEKVH